MVHQDLNLLKMYLKRNHSVTMTLQLKEERPDKDLFLRVEKVYLLSGKRVRQQKMTT